MPDSPEFTALARKALTFTDYRVQAASEIEQMVMELAVLPARLARDDAERFEPLLDEARKVARRARGLMNQITEGEAEQNLARLEMTRLLLARGWSWDDIELSVWSYHDLLREAALRNR